MYLVDTSVLIWILRGEPRYVRWFESVQELPLFLSAVTIAEVYKNIFPAELLRTEEILRECSILDVTGDIARQAGLYWQQFSKKLTNLHILDCMIAATAKEHNLEVITLNNKHFPMNDILVHKGTLAA